MTSASDGVRGLVRLQIDVAPEFAQAVVHALINAGALGVEERGSSLIVYTSSDAEEQSFMTAVRQVPGAEASRVSKDVLTEDYHQIWQAELRPVAITAKLTLRPTTQTPAPEGEQTIWYQPDVSFGSGEHPTTRLAARAVERLGTKAPEALLDVGTGTGVLSLVALRSGFKHVTAVDIDQQAVRATARNLQLNQAAQQVQLALGSAEDVSGTFPVVCANIISSVLLAIKEALAARVAPAGKLVLTGLLNEEVPEVQEAFAAEGLQFEDKETEEDWSLLVLTREPRALA